MNDADHPQPQPSAVPLPEWLGLRVLPRDDGRTAVELIPRPEALNYRGEVHGGTLATVADVAMAIAASERLSEGVIPVTAGLQMHYLRPAVGAVVAVAEVVASSARRRITQAVITDSDGQEVAAAMGTFALVPSTNPPPPPLPAP